MLAGTQITTTGDIELVASASDAGSLPLPALGSGFESEIAEFADYNRGVAVVSAEATSAVTVTGATLTGDNVTITSASTTTPNAAKRQLRPRRLGQQCDQHCHRHDNRR